MNSNRLTEHDRPSGAKRIRRDVGNHAPYPQSWPPESLKGLVLNIPPTVSPTGVRTSEDMIITLVNPVLSHNALPDRGSFVYAVKTSSSNLGDEHIARFSCQVDTRRAEPELLEIARLSDVEHLPRVHAWGSHWTGADNIRKILYDKTGAKDEDRTLYGIVYSNYLPLQTLFSHSPQHIPTMTYQLINCVHDLRYKANILHRNINADNVMYEYRGNRLYFILIDFDAATVLTEDYVPNSKHRPGTLAFRAVDLIRDAAIADYPGHQPILHMLCHEYESIYWLSLWCTLVLVVVLDSRHRELLLETVRAWETKKLYYLAGNKFDLRQNPLDVKGVVLPPAAVDAQLDGWFLRWTGIWIRRESVMTRHAVACMEAKSDGCPEPLDYETSGGVLSRDNLWQELNEVIQYHDDVEVL